MKYWVLWGRKVDAGGDRKGWESSPPPGVVLGMKFTTWSFFFMGHTAGRGWSRSQEWPAGLGIEWVPGRDLPCSRSRQIAGQVPRRAEVVVLGGC